MECALFFFVVPTLLAIFMRRWFVFAAIYGLAGASLFLLLRDRTFARRQLWNVKGFYAVLPAMIVHFVVLTIGLAAILAIYKPGLFFDLPRRDTRLWAIIMVAYPILSVYAQEIGFRAMFIHRYRVLFGDGVFMMLANAAAFAYAHVIMHNGWAILYTWIGGVLISATYLRSRSLFAACVEHAMYGCFMFTIGWGAYFVGQTPH